MTKKRLESYRDMLAEAEEIKEQLEELEEMMASPRVPDMDGMPRGSSKMDSAAILASLIELRDKYIAKVQAIAQELSEIENAISDLPPVYRRILRGKYINGESLVTIAARVGYSYAHIKRLHEEAIKNIEIGKR